MVVGVSAQFFHTQYAVVLGHYEVFCHREVRGEIAAYEFFGVSGYFALFVVVVVLVVNHREEIQAVVGYGVERQYGMIDGA